MALNGCELCTSALRNFNTPKTEPRSSHWGVLFVMRVCARGSALDSAYVCWKGPCCPSILVLTPLWHALFTPCHSLITQVLLVWKGILNKACFLSEIERLFCCNVMIQSHVLSVSCYLQNVWMFHLLNTFLLNTSTPADSSYTPHTLHHEYLRPSPISCCPLVLSSSTSTWASLTHHTRALCRRLKMSQNTPI